MERTTGIEPVSLGWKPKAQPLRHVRIHQGSVVKELFRVANYSIATCVVFFHPPHRTSWHRWQESNLQAAVLETAPSPLTHRHHGQPADPRKRNFSHRPANRVLLLTWLFPVVALALCCARARARMSHQANDRAFVLRPELFYLLGFCHVTGAPLHHVFGIPPALVPCFIPCPSPSARTSAVRCGLQPTLRPPPVRDHGRCGAVCVRSNARRTRRTCVPVSRRWSEHPWHVSCVVSGP